MENRKRKKVKRKSRRDNTSKRNKSATDYFMKYLRNKKENNHKRASSKYLRAKPSSIPYPYQ